MTVETTTQTACAPPQAACAPTEAHEDRITSQAVAATPTGQVRRAWERGMATAEYAIGILAAVAVALALAKYLTGADFITQLTKMVGEYIGQIASTIKVAK